MKRLWILLVALAMLGAMPIFASDITLSGEFMGFGSTDFDTMSGAFPKVELNLNAAIDDVNTLKLEMDSEGGDWPGNVGLDDVRLITDWGAALDLPLSVKTTIGYFDTYFTGWYYYENSGWSWYYDWDNLLVQQGPDANGAVQLDVGFGPVNFHWYNDGAGQDFMVGLDGAFAGLSFWLAYGSTFQAFGDGNLSVEAAYSVLDRINASLFFRYGLPAAAYTFGVNLGANFGGLHIGAGLEGDNAADSFLDNVVIELTYAVTDAAKVAAVAFMDLGGPEAFAGVDISGAYKVGAANFIVGYMYRPAGAVAAPVYFSADNYSADGLYLGVDVDY